MNKKIKLNDRLTIFCCVGGLFSKNIEGFINEDVVNNILSKEDSTDILNGIGKHSVSKLLQKKMKISDNALCLNKKGYYEKIYNKSAYIEELELYLSPFKKRLAAREIAKLVNRGMKVILTTNCDTIIKEFDSLVLLAENFKNKEKIAKKLGYSNDEYLKKSQISIYEIQDGELKSCEYKEYAFHVKCMDDVIDDMNRVFNTLSFELEKIKHRIN